VGASGYLLKDVGSDALAEAVRAASRGESPLQPAIARKILMRLRASVQPAAADVVPALPTEGLTVCERDILRLLGAGATNREIANDLSLTEGNGEKLHLGAAGPRPVCATERRRRSLPSATA